MLKAIQSFKEEIQGLRHVQILSDNVVTVAYINHLGGPCPELSDLMTTIWAKVDQLGVILSARHLSGVLNFRADLLSHLGSTNEWKLHPKLFQRLDKMWGPHTVDRFATSHNTQLPVFNSLVLGPRYHSSGCHGSRLDKEQQLCESPLLSSPQNFEANPKTESNSYSDCTMVASSAMVSDIMSDVDKKSRPFTKQSENILKNSVKSGTMEKCGVASICLEDLWKQKLKAQGWSERSNSRFIAIWAPSTLHTYNKALSKFELFCVDHGFDFPNVKEHQVAEYLCYVASNSDRSKSVLNTTAAAITCFCEASGIKNFITQDLSKLMIGLIKSSTTRPLQRSKVMPLERFSELFLSWPGNYLLTVDKLRLKCIVLLAIAAMLRPLDAAPLARVFDEEKQQFKSVVLSTKNLKFNVDGSLTIIFHGIKNDYTRDGFEVNLQPSSNPRLDPVHALQCYINKTKYLRTGECPLFISLKKPYGKLSAKAIARILDKAIELVDLKKEGFSAKHFRPSAATKAIQEGINPNSVMRTGRWRSRDTFENHYVHAFPILSFTDKLLDVHPKEKTDSIPPAKAGKVILQQL